MNTNEIYSVVKQQILEELPDGLQHATALLNHLTTDGKEKLTGGIYIQTPIKLIKNASQGFIAGTGGLVDVTPARQLDYAVFNWKYYYVNANFTLADYNVSQGSPEAVVNFIEKKTEGAMEDAMREIASALWTGSSAAPLAPEGIADVCAASGTAYGGLTDTDYTDDATAWLSDIETATTLDYSLLATMISKIRGRMKVYSGNNKMLGLMNEACFSKMLTQLQGQQIFSEDKALVAAGFDNFTVNGTPIALDGYATGTQDGATNDNWVVIFPKKVMKLIYNYGFGNESPFDGEARIPNQPIMSVQSYMSFNMICNNRRLVSVDKTVIA